MLTATRSAKEDEFARPEIVEASLTLKTILLIHDGHGPIRGSEKVVFDLLAGINPAHYRWHVLTNHKEFAEACRDRGIPTELLSVRLLFLGGVQLKEIWDLLRYAALTVGIIRRQNASLIHVNNAGACSWAILAVRHPAIGAPASAIFAP
jgi:hypothetical protein